MKTFALGLRQGLQRTIYPLSETTTIGRAPENTITVVHQTVSRQHARLSLEGDNWIIEDLGSVNGIVFEGKRVDNLKLRPGDTFRIGEVEFYFFDMDVPQGRTQYLETVEILLAAVEEDADHLGQGGTLQRLERIQDVIARIPLFSSLEETDYRRLVENAAFHVFDAGELIIQQGHLGGSIYAVLDGKVRVFTKDQRDNELELAVLGPREIFGELSLLAGKFRSESVTALETTVLAELSYSAMRKLMKEYPDVEKKLLRYRKERFQDMEKKLAGARMRIPSEPES
ncbi:MAG: cyclic nucleotide-binding domain-containing protein [Deltaproteobacteria bacterium]|nr:cyclic nucleotide-binding domain-containing protein [Deltaproteobacteria bacterium]